MFNEFTGEGGPGIVEIALGDFESTERSFFKFGRKYTAVIKHPVGPRHPSLFARALKHHIEMAGWQVIKTSSYRVDKLMFGRVGPRGEGSEKVFTCGKLILQKGRIALIVAIDIPETGVVIIRGPYRYRAEIDIFVAAVNQLVKHENCFNGAKA